jgi:formate hydrogenlyase subunit 3/multisubunit Na+/H+ antiporter MnhD subunit
VSPPWLVLGAGLSLAASGLLALALFRRARAATWIAAFGALGAAAAGLAGSIAVLAGAGGGAPGLVVAGVDPLSAFFLVPLFALGGLCAVYGRAYLGPRVAPAAGLNLLLASMVVVITARHALLFLMGWEAMTLLAFLLVTVDHRAAEVRRAGWVYLIASHLAVLALIGLFLGLGGFATAPAAGGRTVLLALALLGFGIKAGVVGMHVWLPEAHAAAPSHVSALMSGVLVKVGLYGLLRAALLLSAGPRFGVTLMVLGLAGALLGISLALGQRDLKRVLAYSTVENVGIILVAFGLGFWARAQGEAPLAGLAFCAGLLHIWNHAAMKGLLFLAAGGVVHATGTRDLERLGGLLPRMPWTGGALLLGAVAISGLPTLNGFAGEWLLYRALTEVGAGDTGWPALAAMGGAAVLALAGGLALLCFVRLIGVALLGTPRSDGAVLAHEPAAAMTLPVAALAALCLAGGVAAPWLVTLEVPLLRQLAGAGVDAPSSALMPIAGASLALAASVALAAVLLRRGARGVPVTDTWGCGHAAATPRMQYGARGFSELLYARVLPRWLRPRPAVLAPEGLLPRAASFASDTTDPLTRAVYEPLLTRLGDRFVRLRALQQGQVHLYIVYIVVATVGALGWVALRDWWAR